MTATHVKFGNLYPNGSGTPPGNGEHNRHWEYWNSLMDNFDSYFGAGLKASRPAATALRPGQRYYATDWATEYIALNATTWGQVGVQTGTICTTLAPVTAVVPGYLTMIGQTIANGQTLYPELWAILPASMKSGSSIVFPDTRGCVLSGTDNFDVGSGVGNSRSGLQAIGALVGAKNHVLTTAELAAHAHGLPTHQHTGTSDGQNQNHQHYVNFNTGGGGYHAHTLTDSGDHQHQSQYLNMGVSGGGVSTNVVARGDWTYTGFGGATNWGGNHNHGVYAAADHVHGVTGWADPGHVGHTHTFTTAAGGAAVANAGGGAAHNNMQPSMGVALMVKL